MEIPSKLLEEISQYCKVNNIEDVDTFIVKMLKQGFNVERYGMGPGMITHPHSEEVQPATELVEIKDISVKNKKEENKDLYGE